MSCIAGIDKAFGAILHPWTKGETDGEWKFVEVNEVRKRPSSSPWDVNNDDSYDGDVNFQQRNVAMLYHTGTKQLHLPQKASIVAAKCFAIALANPVVAVGRVLFHIIKIPIDLFEVFINAVKVFIDTFSFYSIFKSLKMMIMGAIVESTLKFCSHVWEIIRGPLFAVGIQIAAVRGFISGPYNAMANIASLENRLNHGSSRRTDILRAGCFSGKSFRIARCFESRGKDLKDCKTVFERKRNSNYPKIDVPRYTILNDLSDQSASSLSKLRTCPGCPILCCG